MSGIYSKPILPIGKANSISKQNIIRQTTDKQKDSSTFGRIFEQELEKNQELKFSKHSLDRLKSRNINLSKEDIGKISNAVKKAEGKGVRETLVLMENTAFIINVKNKTVITAATGDNLKENVFTNIDGAVII